MDESAAISLTWPEERLAEVLPLYAESRWLQLGAFALLSALVALLVWLFLKRVLARVFARTETKVDDRLLEAAQWPLFVSVFLLGLRIGLERLGLAEDVERNLGNVLQTTALVYWGIAGLRVSTVVLRALARQRQQGALVSRHTEPLFENLAKVAIVILGAYLAIKIWGYDVSGLLAAGGIVGLTVGFAARDTLANLFAGIFIFADSPYKIGDFITLDSGERGKVTEIGIRSTRLLTRDDIEVTIPNAVMGNAKINNESGGPHVKYRIRVRVGVAFGSDLDHVETIQLRVADENAKVCKEPSPRVRFRGFGPSSMDYELLCWVERPVLRGIVTHELVKATHTALRDAGVEIPYSKHDVFIKEAAAAPGTE